MSHAVLSFEVHKEGSPPLKVSQTSHQLTEEGASAVQGYLLQAFMDFNRFLDGLPKDPRPPFTPTVKRDLE